MAYLDSNDAAGNRLRYELPAEEGVIISLGAAEDVTLRYESEGVVAHHAIITPTDGQFSIAPAEGEVLVNGAAITEPMLLVPGVDYALGSLHLSFSPEELSEAEEIEEAPAEEGTEPVRRKVVRRRRNATALGAASLPTTPTENPIVTLITPFYIIAILVAAFVAGLTLRYWILTGGFLPTDWAGE